MSGIPVAGSTFHTWPCSAQAAPTRFELHVRHSVVAGDRRRLEPAEVACAPVDPSVGIARVDDPRRGDLGRGRRIVQRHRQDLDLAMQRVVDDLAGVVRVRDVGVVRLTAGRPRAQRIRRHVHDQPRVGAILRPRGDRVGAAVGVLHLHRRDRLEGIRRVVAHLEDPDAFPAVRVVVSGPRRAAVRVRHRPVHGQEQQVGDAVAVPVPYDRIVLVGVTREVPHQPRAGRIRDVEDPHPAARPGPRRGSGVPGVVAGERVRPPEGEIGVRRPVGRREQLVHLEALIRHVRRGCGAGHQSDRDDHSREQTGRMSHARSLP